MDEKSAAETMGEVIKTILDKADEERKNSDSYKHLFEASDGLSSFISNLEDEIDRVVLDGCAVLENKFGVKNIRPELFNMLLGIALFSSILEKKIIATEGSSCCVDKTHFILAEVMRKIIVEQNNGGPKETER